MKIFLLVLTVLLLLIIILLFSKLRGGVSYDENGFKAYIKFWFLKFAVYPVKKKKDKKKEMEKDNEEPEDKPKTDLLNLLRKQIEIVSSIKGRLTISDLSIKMEIGTGNAAETAIICGGIYSAIYSLLGASQNIFFINRPEVVINPDYTGKTAKGEYKGEISARVITYISIAIKAFKVFKD